jgi:16S rRNA G966 N2-methylase RsmD
LRRNVGLLSPGSFRLIPLPVARALAELADRSTEFDLVFADPPYSWLPDTAFLAACGQLLRTGGTLTVEHSARIELPVEAGALVRTDSRRYGESVLSFFGRS